MFMKKKNVKYIVFLSILIVFISLMFLIKYVLKEVKIYNEYDDFVRASDVIMLSYNKDLSVFTSVIRRHEASILDCVTTQGDIIYDFSKYGIIPSLSYLNKVSEDENLIKEFYNFSLFISSYNSIINDSKEDILVKDNNKTFKKIDDKYIYKTRKNVITKRQFNDLYNEYLKKENKSSVLNNFLYGLLENKYIKNTYKYNELKDIIINDYDKFYLDNEDIIINVITNDLKEFLNYLNNDVINFKDMESNLELKKELDSEVIEIDYKFTKLKRIYNSASKYYRYSYKLDVESLFNEIHLLGYPIFYC